MKRALLILTSCLCAFGVFADALITLYETSKTNSDSGTPVQIATSSTPFKSATFYGKKAARTDNTGSVYLGVNSTNTTQFVVVPSGGSVTVTAPPGYYYDLTNIWLDVDTASDGVHVSYSMP